MVLVAEALLLMIGFGSFVVSLIGLVLIMLDIYLKNNHH
ncbi:putative holin-like toxin [Staphylococcus americanisciuri]|uniref:Holin-like toxin n=1 Tax=Staphylococcus americanisciuri TaxID=2973940 RepID=A0ABT2F3Y6_9STAP|nr:putative holin-like toxin [Staphylococcus americanisciuri]MCS4486585.1 putative holin-like toxin [Staphylococcus americanisciuri]